MRRPWIPSFRLSTASEHIRAGIKAKVIEDVSELQSEVYEEITSDIDV
jgi:hypothetical protein